MFVRNILCSSLCPLLLVLSLGTTKLKLGPTHLTPCPLDILAVHTLKKMSNPNLMVFLAYTILMAFFYNPNAKWDLKLDGVGVLHDHHLLAAA